MPLLLFLGCRLVGEVAVPGSAEVSVTPGPLLLAGREMVGSHMEHTRLRIVLIASLEVEAAVHGHITRGHRDVTIIGDVDTGRIVHLVISACGDGEGRDSTLAMVEHGIHIGWEDTLIGIVHLDGWVGPPEEGLGHIRAVIEHSLYFKIGTSGTQGESRHSLLMEHLLHLAHPYGHRPVTALLDGTVGRHKGGGTVVLGPVELDATRDPGTHEPHEGRLHHMVVIHKVALLDLVISHLHPSAQFGQNHDLDIVVLQPYCLIDLVHLLVADGLNDGIGINHST